MDKFELDQRSIDMMTECGIPGYMHGGLIRYFNNRIPPGHFLTALLSNDFMEMISRADDTNTHCLKAYAVWLYNYAPGRGSGMWGTPEAVEKWLAGREVAA